MKRKRWLSLFLSLALLLAFLPAVTVPARAAWSGDGTAADPYQIVTVLYRLEGQPETEFRGVFSDVPAGKWYSAPVEWAASAGIVLGYGDGTYGRSDDVTREQLAVILYRYAVWKGWAVPAAALEAPDGDAVSDWAAEAVAWAAANGILAADEDGSVRPGEAATRAEIAKAIRAFLEKVAE